MAENEVNENVVTCKQDGSVNGESKTSISVNLGEAARRETVCKVCGHINRGNSFICKMCSNYLFD